MEFKMKPLPVTLTAAAILAIAIVTFGLWLKGSGPKPIFDFDDGTTQGWINAKLFSDQGSFIENLFTAHWELHQCPNNFPCLTKNGPNCDGENDKKGSLMCLIPLDNVSTTSIFWRADLVSKDLTNLFQSKSEFEAYIGQILCKENGHITADILLKVDGLQNPLEPIGGLTKTGISKDAWTHLSAKFAVPPNSYIRNIVIRIQGDWKGYNKLYTYNITNNVYSPPPGVYTNGGIFVDYVAAIK